MPGATDAPGARVLPGNLTGDWGRVVDGSVTGMFV